MKTKLLAMLGLLVAFSATAQDALLKSASGTTTAAAYFPARQQRFQLTSYDVTADNATNRLSITAGTAQGAALKAVGPTATAIVFPKILVSAISNNAVVWLQNAAESVAAVTVTTNAYSTNQLITVRDPLATNIAIGDVIRERSAVEQTILYPVAATGKTLYMGSTTYTNLTTNDVVVIARGGATLLSNAVDYIEQATNRLAQLNSPATFPVTAGDTVYEISSTYAVVTAAAGAAQLYILTDSRATNFAAGDKVLVQSGGNSVVLTVDTDGGGATGVTNTGAAGFTVAVGSRVYELNAQTYTTRYSTDAGATSLLLDVSTGLAAGDNLCIDSTTYGAWRATLAAATTASTAYNCILLAEVGAAIPAGAKLYEVSGTALTATFDSARETTSLITDVGTGVAAGDTLVIFGNVGLSPFTAVATAASSAYRLSTITFTGQIGQVMGVGDSVYSLDTGINTLVGNATLRRDNASGLYFAPPLKPVRVLITGAAACSLNSVIGVYQ